MGGECSTYGGEERCIQAFGGRPKDDRPTGRPRHRWEDNVKMDLKGIGWKGVEWILLAQVRDMR